MKKAYFGISKSNRPLFNQEIDRLKKVLTKYDTTLCVFVDQYNFSPNQEREMMETAFKEIDESDFLIVEVTKKAIGVGVEVGYAFAKKKPIIYIKRKDASYSTTVGGSAQFFIDYENEKDLEQSIIGLLPLKKSPKK